MQETALVLVDYEKSSFMKEPISNNGLNSFEVVLAKLKQLDLAIVAFSSDSKTKSAYYFDGSLYSLLEEIDSQNLPYENYVFFHSNMPALDVRLSEKILSEHCKNIADYTFAEHYPLGFAPFALNKSTLKKIFLLSKGNNAEYNHASIPKIIHFDLNSYDVEVVIAREDLRFLREDYFLSSKRSFSLIKDLLDEEVRADKLLEFYKNSSDSLRKLPVFFKIELCSKQNQSPLYAVSLNDDVSLNIVVFQKFLADLERWVESAVIELGANGEPLLHPQFTEILAAIKNYPQFQFILKTNGVDLEQYFSPIIDTKNLDIIFQINAPEKNLYKKIHGSDDFEKVEENIEILFKQIPKRTYLEIIRMKQNELELDLFLDRWRVFNENIIIQKYNDFCQKLPNEKVVDLSPLNRFPCWKLQREAFIHADAFVSVCSQDLDKSHVLGNLKEEDLSKIWQKASIFYEKHWKSLYPDICKACDEWYSFSF